MTLTTAALMPRGRRRGFGRFAGVSGGRVLPARRTSIRAAGNCHVPMSFPANLSQLPHVKHNVRAKDRHQNDRNVTEKFEEIFHEGNRAGLAYSGARLDGQHFSLSLLIPATRTAESRLADSSRPRSVYRSATPRPGSPIAHPDAQWSTEASAAV